VGKTAPGPVRRVSRAILGWWKRQQSAILDWVKRQRQRPAPAGRYAPRLWPVPAALALAVLGAAAAGYGIYAVLRDIAEPKETSLDVLRAAIGVAAFFGAVLAGVYAYRKQRLAEGDAHRSDAEQLATRYTTAAEQLGHEKAAVRLAGVYAMARLADDWPEERQTCIAVLCAYLRLPYDPDPKSPKHKEGEREVRQTIIRLIRDHLLDPDAATSWCGRDLDFTGAVFDGGTFSGAKFTGGRVSFVGAKFPRGRVLFDYAEFSGSESSFEGAEFSGGEISFVHAKFSGGDISFSGARFSVGMVSFLTARFDGSWVSFGDAEFAGGVVSFGNAIFSLGMVDFGGAKFSGSDVFFGGARYSLGKVSFDPVADWSRPPQFDFVEPPPGVELPRRKPDVPASAQAAAPSAATDESGT
jgi:hypothetical protein